MTYAILKSLHVIAMVTWFAGLFYLPRLFVYHAMAEDQVSIDRFKVMERKLYYGITTPGGLVTVLFGVWLIVHLGWDWFVAATWLHVKLSLVALLVAYHVYLGVVLNRFKHDRNTRSHRFYRIINELPVLILVAVVLLAFIKPGFS